MLVVLVAGLGPGVDDPWTRITITMRAPKTPPRETPGLLPNSRALLGSCEKDHLQLDFLGLQKQYIYLLFFDKGSSNVIGLKLCNSKKTHEESSVFRWKVRRDPLFIYPAHVFWEKGSLKHLNTPTFLVGSPRGRDRILANTDVCNWNYRNLKYHVGDH